MNAPKAALDIIDVLDDPSAMGARNSISAAREILDRNGLVKREQVEVSGNSGATSSCSTAGSLPYAFWSGVRIKSQIYATPVPDRFIAYVHTSFMQKIFYIS